MKANQWLFMNVLKHPKQVILAIDPAARTGFAHSNGQCGVWLLGSGELRLQVLDEKISAAIAEWGCDVIAYESATFGSRHAHVQRLHNELAGVIQLVAIRAQVKCWAYPPPQWKALALGKGNVDKAGVKRLLRIVHGIELVDSDIADAVGILKAAERGPPPPTQRKQRSDERKRIKKLPKLF